MDLESDILEPQPQEVLAHLNSLGYHNITKDQLKDFMKDLKKLIRYDLKKHQLNIQPQKSPKRKNDLIPSSSAPSLSTRVKKLKKNIVVVNRCDNTGPNAKTGDAPPDVAKCDNAVQESYGACTENVEKNNVPDWVKPNECEAGPLDIETSCRIFNVLPEKRSTQEFLNKINSIDEFYESSSNCKILNVFPEKISSVQFIKFKDTEHKSYIKIRSSDCKASSKISANTSYYCNSRNKYDISKKEVAPVGSFIRSVSATRTTKKDPVSLYHHYQALWSQWSLPGENPHASLRWKIRHKMMGGNNKMEEKVRTLPKPLPPWVS